MNNKKLTRIKVLKLRPNRDADISLPKYMSDFSSGMDIFASIETKLVLKPGDIELVSTGIAVEIPNGFEIQIRPRSGLAIKWGIGILNSPGTIDADYRGEIKIILINLGKRPFVLTRGERIAQMILKRVEYVEFEIVKKLNETKRGCCGFGHTGL